MTLKQQLLVQKSINYMNLHNAMIKYKWGGEGYRNSDGEVSLQILTDKHLQVKHRINKFYKDFSSHRSCPLLTDRGVISNI